MTTGGVGGRSSVYNVPLNVDQVNFRIWISFLKNHYN